MIGNSRICRDVILTARRNPLLAVALGLIFSGIGQTEAAVPLPFPHFEAASPECRSLANAVLTAVLEREGLYTMFGDLKPMSSVSVRGYREEAVQSVAALMKRYDEAAAALSDHDLTFRMQYLNEWTPRAAQVFVFRHRLLQEKVREHAATFAAESIDPGTPIRVIVERVMKYDFQDVDRVTGLLYGFPEHAVDFFCHPQKYGPPNTLRRLENDRGGVRIETYDRGSAFVYVLPRQGEYTTADVGLALAAPPILAEFRRRRALHVNKAGELDAVALVRHWVSESNAERPGAAWSAPSSSSAGAPTSETRSWMRAWMGSWAPAKPGTATMAAISDDGDANSLRFEFIVGAQYFQFRLVRERATEGARLVPVKFINSTYDESSFVVERLNGDQWRLRSRYNQRYRDERERAQRAAKISSPTAPALNESHDWGAFKRALSVQEAMARGKSEHWARPLPNSPLAGSAKPDTSGQRPETEPIVFDARWHEFGLYLREFSAAVRHRMYACLLEGTVKPPRFTACNVRFTLNAKGEIGQMTPQGQVYGQRAWEIARAALQGGHRPWTPEMVAMMGDQQNITFRFYFDY
jgi:hypothetical protein